LLIAPPGHRREGLQTLLDSAGLGIVGRADDFEGIDVDLAEEAEAALVDASVEPLEELLETLQESGILRDLPVVLLTNQATPLWVNQAVRAGVRAVLPAEISAEQLASALDAVVQGLVVIHPSELQTERAAGASGIEVAAAVEPLTARERDVLQMLARGLGNKQIADHLKISEHTVKFHVASILGKLGASTRTEAVSIALQRGLILL
jgi:DNA-binding NarL/FixJ family response regulator